MTYVLVSVISFITGGIFGVVMMCLFQINRLGGNAKFENDESEIGGQ